MEKFLLYIKHNFSFLWKLIESFNILFLDLFFQKRIDRVTQKFEKPYKVDDEFYIKKLNPTDLEVLENFINQLDQKSFQYFKPHGMTKEELSKVLKQSSMLKFGYFNKDDKLIGYFILRLFMNKKAFIGRIVDTNYRGKGIAKNMAKVLYCIAKELNFRIYSTISKKNIASLNSHKNVNDFIIEKELNNGFYLIRFNLEEVQC